MADHAVVIGIETYPGLSNLKGPCNDAIAFEKWLIDPAGGNLDSANIEKMLTRDYPPPHDVNDAHPVLSDLESLFRSLVINAAMNQHTDGRLFIFVAGHGFADSQDMDTAALFTANAEFLLPLHIAIIDYANFFRRTWAFDEIIVIMDACRNTNPLQEISKAQLPRVNSHANANKVKMFVGFGTGHNQVAREDIFDGIMQGVFTMALLDALKNASPNRVGNVNGSAIKRYIHNDSLNSPAEIKVDEDKDVVFVKRQASGINVEFNVAAINYNHELVIKFGGMKEVYRTVVNNSPVEVELPAGLYKVQIEGMPASTNFEVPNDVNITL